MARADGGGLLYQQSVDLVAAPPARVSVADRVDGFLRDEGLLFGLVAVVVGISLARLANEVTQDTWLSLLAGRTLVHSGLHHSSLTYWSLGKPWIDQQWLAHLFQYGVYSLGGLVLVCFVGVASAGTALGSAILYARRGGATARSVAWLVAASALPFFVGAGNIRTQILVLPLFVVVLRLLLRDARDPSSQVFLVLPVLLLWANLHGSVVVPAALVLVRAALDLRTAVLRRRSLLLAGGAMLACLVTPYGLDIFGYYRRTLLNPSFHSFVAEWRPLSLGLRTAPIMVLGGVAIWLVARNVRLLGRFTVVAQLLLVVLAFMAVRSAVWLGLGSIMLLTPALDAELGHRELANRRINLLIGMTGAAFALIAALAVVSRGTPALASAFPAQSGDVVAKAAGSGTARVFADERFADWLMFAHPQLVGRLAYDASFEQLSSKQVLQIIEWKDIITSHWNAATRGAKVIVVSLPAGKHVARAYRRDPGFRERYSDKKVAVFVRR
jgi:hypothetical protein